MWLQTQWVEDASGAENYWSFRRAPQSRRQSLQLRGEREAGAGVEGMEVLLGLNLGLKTKPLWMFPT